MTLDELSRRGEMEPGERAWLDEVEVIRMPREGDAFDGLYLACRHRPDGPPEVMHPDGVWRPSTWAPEPGAAADRGTYAGYFDDLATLLDHLYVATL